MEQNFNQDFLVATIKLSTFCLKLYSIDEIVNEIAFFKAHYHYKNSQSLLIIII